MHHTKQFLTESDVPFLSLLARSPDISPIEHVWDMIGGRLLHNPPPATTTDELWQQVHAARPEIPKKQFAALLILCQIIYQQLDIPEGIINAFADFFSKS